MIKKSMIFIISGIICCLIPSVIVGKINIIGLQETLWGPLTITDYVCRVICYLVGVINIMIGLIVSIKKK